MRFLLFALVALVSLSAVLGASVEFKSCGTPSFDATITNITADVWPPEKGKDLVLNISGINKKVITSGTYTIQIKVDGIPLPNIDGDIDTFKPLPWPIGNLTFTYSQEIPSSAPSGQYALHISAVDQDKNGIFCITINTKITNMGEGEGGVRGVLSSVLYGQAGDLKDNVRRGLQKAKAKLMKPVPSIPKMRRV